MINKQKAIDDIIENFRWEEVHMAMKALKWTWWDSEGETPSIGQLLRCAMGLLNDAYDGAEVEKENYTVATGGFRVTALVDNETKEIFELRLAFEVTSWEYNEPNF